MFTLPKHLSIGYLFWSPNFKFLEFSLEAADKVKNRYEIPQIAINESSEVFDIIQPGRRVKLKGYRQ